MAKSATFDIDLSSLGTTCAESAKAMKEAFDKIRKTMQKEYFAAGDHKAWAEEIATNAAILYNDNPFLNLEELIVEAAMTFFKEMSE